MHEEPTRSKSHRPAFRLNGVRHQYGSHLALGVDDLSIPAGQRTCLLGPTGAGKSTLLRLLARLEEPSSGRIDFRTKEVARGSSVEQNRSVAMVFQQPIALRRTVFENVAYGLRLRGIERGRVASLVDEVLERFRLSELSSRRADRLSGGQLTLVALARAVALQPDVLLLDEPTANLDPGRVELVEGEIRREQERRGCTVVWSTHNLFQARRIAGHVVLLFAGECVEAGPVETFFDAPRDARTRAFIRGDLVY